jgi:hypothetical protein
MTRSIAAGLAYFGCVFAAGFVLGTVRVVLLRPLLGEVLAVVLELPVILSVAWIVSRWFTRRFEVPARPLPRAAMGATAFALLMIAELSVSVLLFGRSATEHLWLYREISHMMGLAGQVAFALFPTVQIRGAGLRAARGGEGR